MQAVRNEQGPEERKLSGPGRVRSSAAYSKTRSMPPLLALAT